MRTSDCNDCSYYCTASDCLCCTGEANVVYWSIVRRSVAAGMVAYFAEFVFFGTELRKWLYVTLLHSMYSISSRPPRNGVMFRDDGLWGQSKGWGLGGVGFWH